MPISQFWSIFSAFFRIHSLSLKCLQKPQSTIYGYGIMLVRSHKVRLKLNPEGPINLPTMLCVCVCVVEGWMEVQKDVYKTRDEGGF